MKTLHTADAGPTWLLELSGRLMILGWFTLAGITFTVLCGVLVIRSTRRGETPIQLRRAA